MTESAELPPAAQHYLQQLELEAGLLPTSQRQLLLSQIGEHLTDSLADGADASTVLERLGSPRELVAEAQPGPSSPSAAPAWQRVVMWCTAAGAAAAVIGVLGITLAAAAGLRAVLGLPLMLLLVGGATVLLSTVVIGLFLRRAERDADGRLTHALRSRPLLAALLIAACGLLALGVLAGVMAALMFALTGRFRSALIAVPGIVLVVLGIVLLLGIARSIRRQRSESASS